jgi:hypothetical protein
MGNVIDPMVLLLIATKVVKSGGFVESQFLGGKFIVKRTILKSNCEFFSRP